MAPEQILRKAAFKRLIPTARLTEGGLTGIIGDGNSEDRTPNDSMRYEILTQSDFMREYDVNSHKINSIKYYGNVLSRDDEGKLYQKIKSRVSIGFQGRIHTKRLTALIGNNVNLRLIRSETSVGSQGTLAAFREGWEDKDIEIAVHEAVTADGKTGDCAICFYLSDKKVGWRSMSFEKGDFLYPHNDPLTGELTLFGRLYAQDGDGGNTVEYLDVWDKDYYMRYRRDNIAESEGKWVIDIEPSRHGFDICPIAYHRYGGPFWAPSENLIENYELAMSQFCENNAAYALRILYTLGETMEVKSNLDGTPNRVDSPDANAKIGFLEPADSSKSFETQLNKLETNIMRSSFAVETPEIKSGSDLSSLTVKMMFADSYLKALQDAQDYQKFLNRVTYLFKFGYGLEVGRLSDYKSFKVKAELLPFIFMSETEVINSIVQLVGVGALSKKSATEIAYNSGYGTADEWDRLISEAHDELVGNSVTKTAQDINVISNARNV